MLTTDDVERTWWRRPSGGREVLNVAAPLIVSSLSWTVMTFVDRVFLHWVSGSAMTAAFGGSVVWFAVLCLPLGICAYGNTFVAQYFGEGREKRIGPAVWQAVWVAVAFTPLMLAAIQLAPAIFNLANHGEEIYPLEVVYFQVLCWGAPAFLVGQALACFYSGRGKTRVVMFVDALFAVVNLALDYILIFGAGPIPALGIVGAGWATVASIWLKMFAYLALVLQRPHQEQFATLTGMRLDRSLFSRLIFFGGPSGLQMLLDIAGFTVFVMLVGTLGQVASQASSMAFSVSMLAFMPIHGMSIAVSILVGQRLGENRDDLAARATWTTFSLAIAYMLIISALYIFTPDLFLSGFFAGEEAAGSETDAVRALATRLLLFVAAYNLFDATLMIFVGAIKGAGDTRYVLVVSLTMAIFLSGLSYLSVEVWNASVEQCWALLTIWLAVMAAAFYLRFKQGKWRQMRVTEGHSASEITAVAAEGDVSHSALDLGEAPPSQG